MSVFNSCEKCSKRIAVSFANLVNIGEDYMSQLPLSTTYSVSATQLHSTQREAGAANYCPFSGEGRFVYIAKLLKVHISPEAYSLDLILKGTVSRKITGVKSGINR